jgi:pimeloyl-ACP methyl ester carboxylesterase
MTKRRKGPSVVMIHGGFCGPWSFEGYTAKFEAQGYKVQRPALRFHDLSEPPEALGVTSLLDYAADLEQSLEALNEPPVLIGHAMGALLAQILAARCRVRAAILLAPSAPWGVPPSTLTEIATAQAMLLKVGFWNKALPPDSFPAMRQSFDRYPPAERDTAFSRLGPESGRVLFEILHWGLDMGRASEVDARKVSCPLLLLAGSEDRINPPGTVERIAALYQDRATYEKVLGMNHWLTDEPGWDAVADKALAWLESL